MRVALATVFIALNAVIVPAQPIFADDTDLGIVEDAPGNSSTSEIYATPRKRGDYKIKDCTAGEEQYLRHTVDRARDSVDLAIPHLDVDANGSTASISLFEVFIGPIAEQGPFVKSILQLVSDFRAVGGKKPYAWRDKPPVFVCVTENTQKNWPDLDENPAEFCEKRPHAWGYGEGHYRFVFLCPRFWKKNQVEPPENRAKEDACPRVHDNHFVDADGERLSAWQKYLIIHELLHQYLADGGLGEKTKPPEVYGLDDCVGLERSRDRTRNPNNIVFWIAMIEQGCTDAPDPYSAPFGRGPGSPRGLASQPMNSTGIIISGNISANRPVFSASLNSSRNGSLIQVQ